jgi:hypothetical protein
MEKNIGDEPILGYNTYTHGNETACITILNKQKMSFLFFNKNREQEGKPGPIWGWAAVWWGGYKERGSEGEYGENILYMCM